MRQVQSDSTAIRVDEARIEGGILKLAVVVCGGLVEKNEFHIASWNASDDPVNNKKVCDFPLDFTFCLILSIL